jgi:hypothetical protein
VTAGAEVASKRSLVDGPLGWAPLLTVVGGVSALMLGTANSLARLELPGVEALYWAAFPLVAIPVFVVLLLPNRPRRERIALVILLGIELLIPDRVRSPASFTGYDELLHFRSLEDILRFGHLFQPNPLLTVGPFFPGLETLTSAVVQVSGADPYTAGVVVIGFIRLIFATGVFLLFEEVAGSSRIAGLAAALYAVNPSFVSFDGSFAYESMALPLIPLILLLAARWSRSVSSPTRARVSGVIAVLLGTLIVTHHLTSYSLVALLLGWAVVQWLVGRRDRYRSSVAMIALLAMVGVGLWLFSIASITLGYLFPPLNAALQQAIRLITTGVSRELFESATGSVAPFWQRAVAFAATGLLLACLAIGLVVTWRRFRDNSLALLLMVLSLGYPASLALRLTPSGAEAAARSSAIVYLGLAFVVAYGVLGAGDAFRWLLGRVQRLRVGAWARSVPETVIGRTIAACAFGGLLVAAVIVGTSPDIRFPGPYLVEADARSIDAQSLAAAAWTRDELGEDRRFAADRDNRLLLGAYGMQDVLFGQRGLETWQMFVSPSVGDFERTRIRALGLDYLLIDRRLAQGLPVFSIYYEEGEIAHGLHETPISLSVLGKWDHATNIDRIYDSGDIQVYDVSRIGHAT